MARDGQPVRVGRIVGIFGLAGWLKVQSYTRHREDLFGYREWQLSLKDGWRAVRLRDSRVQGRSLVAHLEGCDDRDQARLFVGADIGVSWSDLPFLPQGEFYWAELQGLRVVDVVGHELGVVSHLLETGANDVLVVRYAGEDGAQGERLIPYIRSAVQSVDIEAGLIHVDWEID